MEKLLQKSSCRKEKTRPLKNESTCLKGREIDLRRFGGKTINLGSETSQDLALVLHRT